jgi:hypothetical protein
MTPLALILIIAAFSLGIWVGWLIHKYFRSM